MLTVQFSLAVLWMSQTDTHVVQLCYLCRAALDNQDHQSSLKLSSKLPGIRNHNRDTCPTRIASHLFDSGNHIHPRYNFSKYYMLPIEPWSFSGTKEELRTVHEMRYSYLVNSTKVIAGGSLPEIHWCLYQHLPCSKFLVLSTKKYNQ